jgi:serine-type D-Ala-D-Ala carboxypeptidase (penicillin-binding protein 5/6)
MTALLVLEHYPLSGPGAGFTVMVTAMDARAEAEDVALDQSVAAVRAGEQLTERQMLEELLLPSANNIARMLAVRVGGSEQRFIAEMNAEAHALGMNHTMYTDPSGWDAHTVSTAADQLRVFRQAMQFALFRQIVSIPSATVPVAGTLANTNPVIGEGIYGKTGSDSAAGACLAFFTHIRAGGHQQIAAGVVLGQGEGGSTSVSLVAAGQAAERLVESVAPGSFAPTVVTPTAEGGQGRAPASRNGARGLPPLGAPAA